MNSDGEGTEPGDGAAPASGWRRLNRWIDRHTLSKLGLELLSVFIGVSLAFWLDNERAAHQRRETQKAVYQALADEVRLPARGGTEMDLEIQRGVTEWRTRFALGEKPVPYTFMMRRSPRPPTGVWEASMSSGLISLVDTKLLFCLARYYRRLESSGEEYVAYKQFVENEVLPYSAEPLHFYDQHGRLKPLYAGSMQKIIRWHDEHVRVVHDAQQLLAALEQEGPAPKCS